MFGAALRPVRSSSRRRRALVVGLCALAVVPMALAQTRSRAATPADTTPEPSCGWTLQVSPDKINAFYPDEAATYFVAALPIPVGGSIEIDGQYPHAPLHVVGHLQPADLGDRRSQRPGDRDPTPGHRPVHRRRTARSAASQLHGARRGRAGPRLRRAPNTLYTEDVAGNKSTSDEHLAVLALRVYIPDTGLDLEAGVPLPTLSLDEADGTKTVLPDCPNLQPSTQVTEAIAGFSTPVTVPGLGAFGTNPPTWRKFTNLLTAAITSFADNAAFQHQPLPDPPAPLGLGPALGRLLREPRQQLHLDQHGRGLRTGPRAARTRADDAAHVRGREADGHRPAPLLVDVHRELEDHGLSTGAPTTSRSPWTATATTRS